VVALVAIGMGAAFFLADRRSPTSRALSLFLAAMGCAVFANVAVHVRYPPEALPWWAGGTALFETVAFIAGFEWGIRVGRTVTGFDVVRGRGELRVRIAQALVLGYCGFAFAFPEIRARAFLSGNVAPDLHNPGFYLFAVPLMLAGLLVLAAALMLLRQRPDKAERMRILGLLCAMPFLASGLLLPIGIAPIGMALGEVIFLVGAVQYHVLQGQRGQFIARFLSPQVEQLVRERGLRNAMRTSKLVISTVFCDLRGFTAYAKASEPDRVIQILREYYRTVGKVVSEHGGTIKDQAGDGILILMGAPIPHDDHAQRALEMARAIREKVRPITTHWSDDRLKLGVGIGVASGQVAVGVIGDASRLEYTAVGSAVNLCCRLCEQAADGEILVDAKTIQIAGRQADFGAPKSASVKGFSKAIDYYGL
jgi:class 3 adenylate cyclase